MVGAPQLPAAAAIPGELMRLHDDVTARSMDGSSARSRSSRAFAGSSNAGARVARRHLVGLGPRPSDTDIDLMPGVLMR